MASRWSLANYSVRWRFLLMALCQVGLSLAGFALLMVGLSSLGDRILDQSTLVSDQQKALSEQTQRFQVQQQELAGQLQALDQQQQALQLQQAVFQVYQVYPQFLFWRLASTSSLSQNDVRNGDDAEKQLRAAVTTIADYDEELAEAIDLFLLDMDDFNTAITRAREAFESGDTSRGRSQVSASQNNVISMTSMLEVVLYVTDEVMVASSEQVTQRLEALKASVAAVEAAGGVMAKSVSRIADANAQTVKQLSSQKSQIIVIIVIITLASLGVAALLSQTILKPLLALRHGIAAIEDHSDLTERVDGSRGDELGRIGGRLNSLLNAFQTMVKGVRSGAQDIADETEAQSARNVQVRDAMNNVNDEINTVAAAINEMSATVQGIHDLTRQTADDAEHANELCATSEQQVNHSAEEVQAMSAQLTAANDRLSALAKQTDDIYAIVDVIQGVSEQTNLLALNAAIEAARAGEQGRGFAVVADEVRTLAQRADQSSTEIKHHVEKFASDVQETAKTLATVEQASEQTRGLALKASQSMSEVQQAMSTMLQRTVQVSQSLQEQTEATAAIDGSVTTIASLLHDVTDQAQASSAAMERLNEATHRLATQARQFKSE